MGKEWVPPGENVGNISICYFWLARRCRCLHNKNTLAVSARLLEKSWHHLERCLYRAAETHRKRREAKAIAETHLQGRHWGHTGWGLIFHTCVWLALFLLSPNPLSSRLHLALCRGRLTFRDGINTLPCPLVSSWVQRREDQVVRGWEK